MKHRNIVPEFKIIDLEYATDLTGYYQKLCDLPGFVLLESTDRQRGRYDILSAFPYDTVKVSKESVAKGTAFTVLQDQIDFHDSGSDLPFQGGAIGFFSYDMACAIAAIDLPSQPSLDAVPLMTMGLDDWAIIVDHHLKKITVFSAGTQADTATMVEEVIQRWHGNDVRKQAFFLEHSFFPLILKSAYEEAFHAIHADLQKGRCYQVNYTQPFHANYTGDSWSVYKAIKNSNPVPYSAFLRLDEAQILCFSPERFIQMDKGSLLTSPIKGTERRVLDPEQDNALRVSLQTCPKNKAENVMIVDLMRNDFGKIAIPGSVSVKGLFEIESYESVHHMVSHITAECLDTLSPIKVFAECFPGGSITGAPKIEAMKVIAAQEPYARGVYCGCIGYFSRHGRFDTNIAIRTITASESILHLAAGGAVVIDSKCDDEYMECFTKIAGILKGLQK